MSCKDANDLLRAGRIKDITIAVYEARAWRPGGIVSFGDVKDRITAKLTPGAPWPWPSLTKATFGRRPGEVYALGAGTGVGKTDVFTQIIANDALKLNIRCGVLYLEQPVAETGKRIAGKSAGARFHVPDQGWTQDELEAEVDKIDATGNVFMFEAFGACDWETVGARIRYMIVGLGCRHIFLDHLTAIAAASDDERLALEHAMEGISSLAQETGAIIHFISHLATPEGKSHEEGGRVTIRNFRGSRAIGYWSHFMFGLERDQQHADPAISGVTTFRCLKDRFTGNATGLTFGLAYDRSTGLLTEADAPPTSSGSSRDAPY